MNKQAGFTLIEVMMAMAILGIGLVVMVESASRALAVIKAARAYEDARHLIERVQVEEPIDPEQIEEGSDGGSFEGRYGDYTWSREITRVGEEEEDYFFKIRTRVSWSDRGQRSHEEVETYLYAPEAENKGSF